MAVLFNQPNLIYNPPMIGNDTINLTVFVDPTDLFFVQAVDY